MKTQETKDIEKALIKRYVNNGINRIGLEIYIKDNKGNFGYVDFITIQLDDYHNIPLITCFEIKVSINDFNSPNGHNLYGDYNYYVVNEEVYKHIKERKTNVGLILFKNNKLRTVRESSKRYYNYQTIESRFRLLDSILVSWQSGSMFRILKDYEITLRNERCVEE